MRQAFVLMTAMPPTKGHRNLIRFAAQLSEAVTVILCTQPGEPFAAARYWSLVQATNRMANVSVQRIHKVLPQEPEGAEGFWDMWAGFLHTFGFRKGDYIVASEPYGVRLAEEVDGIFMPYDLNRTITYTKGTKVREDYRFYWDDILPEFRPHLKKSVTIFGAESVGKTTTAQGLADDMQNTKWYFEWARPYLESVGAEVTHEKMVNIWHGQLALQAMAERDRDSEFDIFDTDLFSTVGYWEMYDPDNVPAGLYEDADAYQSDLYVILSSDIPFEPDPLRYGGNVRESSDQYWIDLCERFDLPYVYVKDGANFAYTRIKAVQKILLDKWPGDELQYTRIGKEYESHV